MGYCKLNFISLLISTTLEDRVIGGVSSLGSLALPLHPERKALFDDFPKKRVANCAQYSINAEYKKYLVFSGTIIRC